MCCSKLIKKMRAEATDNQNYWLFIMEENRCEDRRRRAQRIIMHETGSEWWVVGLSKTPERRRDIWLTTKNIRAEKAERKKALQEKIYAAQDALEAAEDALDRAFPREGILDSKPCDFSENIFNPVAYPLLMRKPYEKKELP